MKTIHSWQDPGNVHISIEGVTGDVHPYPHEKNTTDGSEFLDDAIRMKDQPLEDNAATDELSQLIE